MVARGDAELARAERPPRRVAAMLDHEASTPDWIRRFTAPSLGFPAWTEAAPDRLAMVANRRAPGRSGRTIVPMAPGARLSDEPVGVEIGLDAARRPGRVVARRHRRRARPLVAVAVRRRQRPPRSSPSCPTAGSTGLSFEAGRSALERRGGRDVPRLRGGGRRHHARDRLVLERGGGRATSSPAPGAGCPPTVPCCASGTASTATSCTPRCGSSMSRRAPRSASSRPRGVPSNPPPGPPSPAISGWRSRASSATSSGRRSGTWPPATRSEIAVDLPGAVFPMQWWPGRLGTARASRVRGRGRSCSGSTRAPARATPLTGLVGDIDAAADPAGRRRLVSGQRRGARPPRILDAAGASVVDGARRSRAAGGTRVRKSVRDQPARRPDPHVRRRPRRRRTVPDGAQHPRRPRMARTRPVRPRDAGVRRRRVRGRRSSNYRGSTGYGVAFREALIGRVCLDRDPRTSSRVSTR